MKMPTGTHVVEEDPLIATTGEIRRRQELNFVVMSRTALVVILLLSFAVVLLLPPVILLAVGRLDLRIDPVGSTTSVPASAFLPFSSAPIGHCRSNVSESFLYWGQRFDTDKVAGNTTTICCTRRSSLNFVAVLSRCRRSA